MEKLNLEEKIKLIEAVAGTLSYLTKQEAMAIGHICMEAEARENQCIEEKKVCY